MTNCWFAADHHIWHRAMVTPVQGRTGKLGWRHKSRREDGFDSLEEMEETLIEKHNERVGRADLVYFLGDMSFGTPEQTIRFLRRLNGNIHYVRGNHDTVMKNAQVRECLAWIGDYKKIKPRRTPSGLRQAIILCHYPFITWDGCWRGSWHLHGHCHGNLRVPTPMDRAPRLDVGLDLWGFAPIDLDQVAEALKDRVYIPVDHHGGTGGYE